MISVMNEKMIHEKTKEERKKIIQSKFDYRRWNSWYLHHFAFFYFLFNLI